MGARRAGHAFENAFGHGRRGLDEAPRVLIRENFGRQLRVQRVAGAMRDDVTDDGISDQRQVTDDIENLVADEFVVKTQRVQHAGVADHDRILERAAESKTVLPQPLHFLEEAEGARRGDVVREGGFGNAFRARLVPQQRMIEADRVADLEVIRGVDRNALVACRSARASGS